MLLPGEFTASATALECYQICARRFRNRYIERLPVAGAAQDTAGRVRRGDLFHKLAVWDGLGMDVAGVLEVENDPELSRLWEGFQGFRESLADEGLTVEHDRVLTAICNGVPLTARLDALVTSDDGAVTIYDWKTGSSASSYRLRDHPQSQVYPWVVHELLSPPSLRLVYWFPDDPERPLEIECDAAYLTGASAWLTAQLERIAADQEFEMTSDRRICKGCEYLAHCGIHAEDGDPLFLDEDFFAIESFEDSWLDEPSNRS